MTERAEGLPWILLLRVSQGPTQGPGRNTNRTPPLCCVQQHPFETLYPFGPLLVDTRSSLSRSWLPSGSECFGCQRRGCCILTQTEVCQRQDDSGGTGAISLPTSSEWKWLTVIRRIVIISVASVNCTVNLRDKVTSFNRPITGPWDS